MMRKTLLLCMTCLIMLPPVAHAQLRDADSAIKHRRAAFTLMSTYWGRVISMVEGKRPFDRAELIRNVEMAQYLSKLPWEGFTPGSEIGDTRAEADIWLDEERFKDYQKRMHEELAKFRQSAQVEELPTLVKALEMARSTCNTCHKAFRRDF
jgi:cytochrome c556